MRGEAESKFLGIPVEIPRFWIARQDAARIIPLIDRQQPPVASLHCDMKWERVQASNKNFTALLIAVSASFAVAPCVVSEGNSLTAAINRPSSADHTTL